MLEDDSLTETALRKVLLDKETDYERNGVYSYTLKRAAASSKNKGDTNILLKKVYKINAEGDQTLIESVKIIDDVNLFKYLVKQGPNYIKDYVNKTPCIIAGISNSADVVKCLIEEGNVNINDGWGRTPLHAAARKGDADLVRTLLNAGSGVNREDDKGETPIFYAAINSKSYLPGTEIENGFEDNSDNDTVGVLKLLVERGADVNKKNKFGVTPIYHAIKEYRFCNVMFLLNVGARIDFPVDDTYSSFDDILDGEQEMYMIEMKKLLIKHLIKLRAVNIVVNESIVVKTFHLGAIECESFKETCASEIEKMKSKRFGAVSIHDVLVRTNDPTFADNTEMENFISSDSLKKEFSNYATLLKYEFQEAKKRNGLLKFATFDTKDFWNGIACYLPNEIKRRILCNLKNEDLENLTTGFHDEE